MKRISSRLFFYFILSPCILSDWARGADDIDIATSSLEFGGSMARLIWVASQKPASHTQGDASKYLSLAENLKYKIETSRASSSLVIANFNVLGTTLAYAAVVDPEPLSKGVAGLAAWGAKKTGDAIGKMIIDDAIDKSKSILAQGLKDSGLTQQELSTMTPSDLKDKVNDLKLGGVQIGEIFKDDPAVLDILRANAIDIATDIGVEALANSKGNTQDISSIRSDLRNTQSVIEEYQKETGEKLTKIANSLSNLQEATVEANQKLEALKATVSSNTMALKSLAEISYSGWSTAQKLQAVQSGLFPDLDNAQRSSLIESLTADQKREDMLVTLNGVSKDLSNLEIIGRNIGLPSSVITGLQDAQTVALAVTQFATGDYLGAVASATSLVGLGTPDAATQRHSEMMRYLQEQFGEIHQKLDKVIELQITTLRAIEILADSQRNFRKEVLGQLDRIENAILNSQQISQAILLNEWTSCWALINGTSLNGQYVFPSKDVLFSFLQNPSTSTYASQCYDKFNGFFDAWVKPATWSGQIISASNFPAEAIANDILLQQQFNIFQAQKNFSYISTRDFLLAYFSEYKNTSSVEHSLRLSQPVIDTKYQTKLDTLLSSPEIRNKTLDFRCDDPKQITESLKDLLCFGIPEGVSSKPIPTRLSNILQAALVGPQAYGILDTGVTLSYISNFAKRNSNGTFTFPKKSELLKVSEKGLSTPLRQSLAQHKGLDLLKKLHWLAEIMVLQQSVAYGDYAPQLIEKVLYKNELRALSYDAANVTPLEAAALKAMRANPILANNVVMLAMRHAISDSLGGTQQAEDSNFQQSYYQIAILNYSGPQACMKNPNATLFLADLFPNWKFEYRVGLDEKKNNANLIDCPVEFTADPLGVDPSPAMGTGAALSVSDFYVTLPSAASLASGTFEMSDSLRLALIYRDRINQAIIDLSLKDSIYEVVGSDAKNQFDAEKLASSILNEGFGWIGRTQSEPEVDKQQ